MDKNYPPLDFANVHGTPEKRIIVTVYADDPEFYRIEDHPNPAYNGTFPRPVGHSDTIKFSGSSYITVAVHGFLTGGIEDCVDVNNGSHHIAVIAAEWWSRGKYVATIKGNSYEVYLHGRIMYGGSETDVDLGNFSDQGNNLVFGVVLELTGPKNTHVRLLSAIDPKVHDERLYTITRVPVIPRRWFYPFYNFFKDLLRTFRISL